MKEIFEEIKGYLFITFNFWDFIKDDTQWKPECRIKTRILITVSLLAEFYLGIAMFAFVAFVVLPFVASIA